MPAKQEMHVQSLVWEDPLEKEMASQYSCLGSPVITEAEIGTMQRQ